MEERSVPAPVHADPAVGLTSEQVMERLEASLHGAEAKAPGKTEQEIILGHIFTFFNLVFFLLALLLVLGGSSAKNMGFLGIVTINTCLGIVQELRAKRAVDALVLVARRPVTVIRDGKKTQVPPEGIVRDDIAEFHAGDPLCADGILRTGTITVDESHLTGESEGALKHPGDRLHSGSIVLTGSGRAELTAVGSACDAAKLAREARSDPAPAPSGMMRSLDRLILFIGIALVPLGIILFRQEYFILKLGIRSATEGTVAALVGMIPEGLYLLTTVALAVSAGKLSRQKVLVQNRNCIETLARVDVLCVDKTGTITDPDMDVADVIPLTELPPENLQNILTALVCAHEPENATDRALHALFSGETDWECTRHIPFDSARKWSGTTFREHGSYLIGAPDFLPGDRAREARDTAARWADQGYRVLAAAFYDGDLTGSDLHGADVFPLALILLSGRVKENARQTFLRFQEQGVRIVVISGDSPVTAARIAGEAGIYDTHAYADASRVTDLDAAAENTAVFGRVTPEQKRQLIRALQNHGHTVAMTGDGVNDLLAMKQADVGIAMASGVEAASRLADIVLLDSDFGAMPGIVAEGRRVINNIQRSAALFLVKNIFSLFLTVFSLFLGLPYPLQPVQLTVIAGFTIGIPSYLLTLEPRYDRIHGQFLPGVLRRAFPGGLTNVFMVLVCQAFAQRFGFSASERCTLCACVLAFVGLMVLYQICKPFDRFRGAVWCAMALGLAGSFLLLGDLLELSAGSGDVRLVLAAMAIMTPTVFFTVQRLFDWGQRFWERLRRRSIRFR